MGGKRSTAILVCEPGSTDYLYTEVRNNGLPAADVPDLIEYAFTAAGQKPTDATVWYPGEADADGLHAKLLVGPYGDDGTEPGVGKWDLYLRLTAPPVRPVLKSGRVTIL